MKKSIKVILIIVITVLSILLVIVNFITPDVELKSQHNVSTEKQKSNVINIQKVEAGMTKQEFLDIMGPPDYIEKRSIKDFQYVDHSGMADSPIEYMYETNQISASVVSVVFDTNEHIKYLNIPKELVYPE